MEDGGWSYRDGRHIQTSDRKDIDAHFLGIGKETWKRAGFWLKKRGFIGDSRDFRGGNEDA
jgi:hypothetical protein